ncbi:hypothetical protein L9F63_001981, partial [Diploptera punctata]
VINELNFVILANIARKEEISFSLILPHTHLPTPLLILLRSACPTFCILEHKENKSAPFPVSLQF